MSFNNIARKVRDPSLPYSHRVSALRSCVQLYRPIGFHAALSFLAEQAGPFPRDETALLHALDLIETSRAVRQAELREYATRRRKAKQRGQRSPRPTDPNPNYLQQWHGAPRQAALHAVNYWNRNRLAALLVPHHPAAEDLQRCVTACLDSQGHLTPEQQQLLTHCTDQLEQRLRRHSWRDRPADFQRFWDLLVLARHIKTATTTPHQQTAIQARRRDQLAAPHPPIGRMDPAFELALLPAFPASLAADARVVAQALPPAHPQPAGSFPVWVQGEHLTLPYRLYNPEPAADVFDRLSPRQTKILHCLYTRHHNGHVRHHHLNQVIDATDPWIVPFVVQLVGEYVLDIVITIQQGLIDLDQPRLPHHQAYGRFAAANPHFLHLTGQRVAGYWNCYYRHRYPHRDYPGRLLIDSLQAAAAFYRDTTPPSVM
ncbi:hypothetical protein [Nocardia sp. CNY236]|uniref:hypothetical protein n=1 Tax=Nocardia sp. CNY236 TaxID=1169152 RepID=UPI00040BBDF6|nr:hypothetical protein [Nocardia sp. CNY236]